MLAWIRSRMRALFHKTQMEHELNDELRFHLEKDVERNIAGGMSEEEARLAALRAFGGVEQLKEQCRDARGIRPIEELRQDLRYSIRMIRRNPGFSAIVVITLGLGIGINTAIFALLDSNFRPLPIRDPDAVVSLLGLSAFPDYEYYRVHANSFSSLIARSPERILLNDETGSKEPLHVDAEFVSENFFSALGAGTILGRTFVPEETGTPGKEAVVVLSYGLWHGRFGGDPDIVGRRLHLGEGKSFVVIGVTNRDFAGLQWRAPDIWLPLTVRGEVPAWYLIVHPKNGDWFGTRDKWLYLSGRLNPGSTIENARTEMGVLFSRLATAYPDDGDLKSLPQLLPASQPRLPNKAQARVGIGVVAAAGMMVLLIVCSNIANLMLARAAARQSEIGVRLCLGASRGRLIRQLLTESLLLAGLGGCSGLLLAWGSVKPLAALGVLPTIASNEVSGTSLTPNGRVMVYTFLVSLLCAAAFGLVPALRATGSDLVTSTKDQGASFGHRITGSRFRSGLVVTQVALSVVLLISAGLLLRGFDRGLAMDLGFDKKKLMTAGLGLYLSGYDQARKELLNQELETRLVAMSGVESVSRGDIPLAQRGRGTVKLASESGAAATFSGYYNRVRPNYFETLGIPIVRGSGFSEGEARAAAPVAVVSESTAHTLWPDKEPLGQLVTIEPGGKAVQMGEAIVSAARVIGVARDAQTVQLGESPPVYVYLPGMGGSLLVRTSRDASQMQSQVRAIARGIDPHLLIDVQTLEDAILNGKNWVDQAMVASTASAGLGLLALILAAVGLYGLMAYSVIQRTREIGLRVAIGATRHDLLRLFVGQGMRPVTIGLILGVAGGAAASRLLTSLLFGLNPFDPTVYVGVALFLIAVAFLATYLPARRAASVDPMIALRNE